MGAMRRDGRIRTPSFLFIVILTLLVGFVYFIHPLLSLIPLFLLASCLCNRQIERQTSQRRHILKDATERLEVQEMMITDDTDSENLEFPTKCPECDFELLVSNVIWVNAETIMCKRCESTIKANEVQD